MIWTNIYRCLHGTKFYVLSATSAYSTIVILCVQCTLYIYYRIQPKFEVPYIIVGLQYLLNLGGASEFSFVWRDVFDSFAYNQVQLQVYSLQLYMYMLISQHDVQIKVGLPPLFGEIHLSSSGGSSQEFVSFGETWLPCQWSKALT